MNTSNVKIIGYYLALNFCNYKSYKFKIETQTHGIKAISLEMLFDGCNIR